MIICTLNYNLSCLNHSLERVFSSLARGTFRTTSSHFHRSWLQCSFYNGGLLFSSITFVFIACISLYSFLLLVKTKFVVSGSFGGMQVMASVKFMDWQSFIRHWWNFVWAMDALPDSGVDCSISTGLRSCLHDLRCGESPSKPIQPGLISISSLTNPPPFQAFVLGVTNCLTLIPVQYFILVQLIVFLPLALVRNLAKLSSTALIADGFILVGLVYIFGNEFSVIAQRGIADVKLFNPKDFALFIG